MNVLPESWILSLILTLGPNLIAAGSRWPHVHLTPQLTPIDLQTPDPWQLTLNPSNLQHPSDPCSPNLTTRHPLPLLPRSRPSNTDLPIPWPTNHLTSNLTNLQSQDHPISRPPSSLTLDPQPPDLPIAHNPTPWPLRPRRSQPANPLNLRQSKPQSL